MRGPADWGDWQARLLLEQAPWTHALCSLHYGLHVVVVSLPSISKRRMASEIGVGTEAKPLAGKGKKEIFEAVAWVELVLVAGFGADPSLQRIKGRTVPSREV